MTMSQPRIYVAGHCGLVGSAIVRTLRARGYQHIVTRSHAALELTEQAAVRRFFDEERIDQVYLAAANRHVDLTSRVTHAAPGVHTRQLVLPGTAKSAFEQLGSTLPQTEQNATLIAAIKAMAARRR